MIEATPINVILLVVGIFAWEFGLAFAIIGLAALVDQFTPKQDWKGITR